MSRPYPCAYCTEDGYCKKFSDKEVTSWCVQSPCEYEIPSASDDLIRRADALALAKDVTLEGGAKHRCIDATMIHELPSAEPTTADCWGCKCSKMERLTERRGKWVYKKTMNLCQCSECKKLFLPQMQAYNYCPNCGCDMRGKDE